MPIQSFHILAPLAPFPQDWGLSLSPKHFPANFFRKFFPIRPRRLFSVFLVRKIMGAEGTCRSPNGGGVPFLYALQIIHRLYITNQHSLTPASQGVLNHTIGADFQPESGKNRSKVNIYLIDFVSPREDRRPKRAKC